MLLVGPMLMVTAIGMLTSIQSNTVVQWILTNDALGPVFVLAGKMIPYLLISGVFTFLYVFMPNTNVHFKSALVGGVAGVGALNAVASGARLSCRPRRGPGGRARAAPCTDRRSCRG